MNTGQICTQPPLPCFLSQCHVLLLHDTVTVHCCKAFLAVWQREQTYINVSLTAQTLGHAEQLESQTAETRWTIGTETTYQLVA